MKKFNENQFALLLTNIIAIVLMICGDVSGSTQSLNSIPYTLLLILLVQTVLIVVFVLSRFSELKAFVLVLVLNWSLPMAILMLFQSIDIHEYFIYIFGMYTSYAIFFLPYFIFGIVSRFVILRIAFRVEDVN